MESKSILQICNEGVIKGNFGRVVGVRFGFRILKYRCSSDRLLNDLYYPFKASSSSHRLYASASSFSTFSSRALVEATLFPLSL